MSIMGTRVLRTEDPRLLSEGGVYVDDLRVPELTRAAFATFKYSELGIGNHDADKFFPTGWLPVTLIEYAGQPVLVVSEQT